MRVTAIIQANMTHSYYWWRDLFKEIFLPFSGITVPLGISLTTLLEDRLLLHILQLLCSPAGSWWGEYSACLCGSCRGQKHAI